MLLFLSLACSGDCGDDVVCQVSGGEYQAQAPDGWRGLGDLPVAFHFYGYQGTPEKSFNDTQALREWSGAGVLYVVPEEPGWWQFPGDDSDLLATILDDLDERWGIDRDRLYLTGHSTGASSVHDLACRDPGVWRAASPFSGVFWEPIPDACEDPALPLRHTHGLADETWPWEGRSFGENSSQGDVGETLDFLVADRGCDPEPVAQAEPVGKSTCVTWTGCTSGEDLQLCSHEDGHSKPADWAATSAAWMLAL